MLTLYSGDGCPSCGMVKKYFTFKGVEYTEINVDSDPNFDRSKLQEISGQARVPVITKGSSVVVGYNPAKLASLIS